MAVLTAGTVVAALYGGAATMSLTLWIIVFGTALTIVSRSRRLLNALRARP